MCKRMFIEECMYQVKEVCLKSVVKKVTYKCRFFLSFLNFHFGIQKLKTATFNSISKLCYAFSDIHFISISGQQTIF